MTEYQSPICINTTKQDCLPTLGFHYRKNVQSKLYLEQGVTTATYKNFAQGRDRLELGDTIFNFWKMHFHIPIEHCILIDNICPDIGKHCPIEIAAMEIHIVHRLNNFETSAGEFFSVVSRMVSINDTQDPSSVIYKCLEKSLGKKESTIDINCLLPDTLNPEYYTYHGSLTTRPYTENVHWILLKEHMFVTSEQMEKLKALIGSHGDDTARPLQNIFTREILEHNISLCGTLHADRQTDIDEL